MTSDIPDEAVTAMREAADAYYEHDCTRDDECCYRRPDWLGALSAGLAAALPVLNTAEDSEIAHLQRLANAYATVEHYLSRADDHASGLTHSEIQDIRAELAASLRGEQ